MASHAGAQINRQLAFAGITMAGYKGELASYDQYSGIFQAGVQFNQKEKLNGAFTLSIGTVKGQNPDFSAEKGSPNRFFKTNLFALNYGLHYNIIKKPDFIFYISQGIGIIRFIPQDEFNEGLNDQSDTRAEGEIYRNVALLLPTQIGCIYFLKNNFGFGAQTGFLNTMTDYIDNISELGESGNDNILNFRLALYIPLSTSLPSQ